MKKFAFLATFVTFVVFFVNPLEMLSAFFSWSYVDANEGCGLSSVSSAVPHFWNIESRFAGPHGK